VQLSHELGVRRPCLPQRSRGSSGVFCARSGRVVRRGPVSFNQLMRALPPAAFDPLLLLPVVPFRLHPFLPARRTTTVAAELTSPDNNNLPSPSPSMHSATRSSSAATVEVESETGTSRIEWLHFFAPTCPMFALYNISHKG
jgi:hypothetical protein